MIRVEYPVTGQIPHLTGINRQGMWWLETVSITSSNTVRESESNSGPLDEYHKVYNKYTMYDRFSLEDDQSNNS